MTETMDFHQQNRMNAFAARWNTGDGSPHSNTLIKWFEYYGKRPSPGVLEKYLADLSHIPIEQLEVVLDDLEKVESAFTKKMPLVSDIKRAWSARHKRREQKIAEAKSRNTQKSKTDKQQAKQAVQWHFAQRQWKQMRMKIDLPEPHYVGEFPVKAFVDALELPPFPYEKYGHEAAYNELHRRFDEAWRSHDAADA